MSNPVAQLWNELRVDKELALDFIAVFARFEYSLKKCGFLQGGRSAERSRPAKPDWFGFSEALVEECDDVDLQKVLRAGAYLLEHPTKRQIVEGGDIGWEEVAEPAGTAVIATLLRTISRTRNNLFHGGKFWTGLEEEPLRDTKLVRGATNVLLSCLDLECSAAVRMRAVFWHFEHAG